MIQASSHQELVGVSAGEAELLRGPGDLADVADVRRPLGAVLGSPAPSRADRVAEAQVGTRVTVGGQEPVQDYSHGAASASFLVSRPTL
jgi:hypothetical protein